MIVAELGHTMNKKSGDKFELSIEEDAELELCFQYHIKGQGLCEQAYPVLKKEVIGPSCNFDNDWRPTIQIGSCIGSKNVSYKP